MVRNTRKTITIAAALTIAGGALLAPTAAMAAITECEPGYVSTTFSSSSSNQVPVGSITGSNPDGAPITQSFTVSTTKTNSASVTGSVSLESVIVPLKAEVSATAETNFSWNAGTTIESVTIQPGETVNVVYGFNTVSFSGSQRTCQSTGQFGAPTSFSGVAPTGVYTTA